MIQRGKGPKPPETSPHSGAFVAPRARAKRLRRHDACDILIKVRKQKETKLAAPAKAGRPKQKATASQKQEGSASEAGLFSGARHKYYTYTAADGSRTMVERLDQIPDELRDTAVEHSYGEPKEASTLGNVAEMLTPKSNIEVIGGVAAPSMPGFPTTPALGAGGVGALLAILALFLKPARRMLLKMGLMALISAALSGGYMMWIRHQAGSAGLGALGQALGGGPGKVLNPLSVVDDAKQAAEMMKRQAKEREKQLDALEKNLP